MTTFTEMVAAVVVQSSALALSHFGVTMEPTQVDRSPPLAEHVVARTPSIPHRSVKLTSCAQPHRPTHVLTT